MNFDKVREFVAVRDEMDALESQLEKLKAKKAPLVDELLEMFAEEGVQNIKLEDGRTIYLYSQLRAGGWKDESGAVHTEVTAQALTEAGFDDLVSVTVNSNTLSAWVREQPRDELNRPILPDGLGDKMTIYTLYDVRVRKGRE